MNIHPRRRPDAGSTDHTMTDGNSRRILPLSAEAISQIRSSKHVTTLQGVVLALLENSLDAGATKINVTVDWRRGDCSIDDDGAGIPIAEFAENGGLGRMYCTSKRSPVGAGLKIQEVHGSTGTFLAELAAMSLLSITSKHLSAQQSASLSLHHGKVISRRADDAGEASPSGMNRQHGTSVLVRDLFGNMPVRVKQRAQSSEQGIDEEKRWNELKHDIVALLLAWSRPCGVKLVDTNNESRSLNIAGQHPSTSAALTSRSLNRLAGKNITHDLRDVLPVLFQSSSAPADSRPRWVPLSASTSTVTLKGLVCLDPAPSRHCQFIAIGIHPCSAKGGCKELYDSVNKIFSNSSFGATEESTVSDAPDDAMRKTRGEHSNSRQAQSRRNIDRYPMFCIQLRFVDRRNDTTNMDRMSEASVKILTDVLDAAIYAWLDRNHFRPKKSRKRRHQGHDVEGLSSRPPSRSESASHDAQETSSATRKLHQKGTPGIRPLSRTKTIDLTQEPPQGSRQSSSRTARSDALGANDLSRIRTGQAIGRQCMSAQRAATQLCKDGITADLVARQNIGKASMQPDPIDHHQTTRADTGNQCLSSEDFGSIDDAEMIATAESLEPGGSIEDEDNLLTWTDPVSKQTFRINSRTGVVLPLDNSGNGLSAEPGQGEPIRRRAGIDTTLSSAGKPISLARRRKLASQNATNTGELDATNKVPGPLQDWNNPVFARQEEEPIPVASTHGPGLIETEDDGRCCQPRADSRRFTSKRNLSDTGIKLSRAALLRAITIRQVDSKFILCKIPSISDDTNPPDDEPNLKQMLVLVDQHAASERIMLEGLFDELLTQDEDIPSLTIRTASLATQTARARSLVFEISDRESELLAKYQHHFNVWGMRYEIITKAIPPPEASKQSKLDHRIIVKALPAVVAERCANFPALCIEMLRTELWELADGLQRPIARLKTPISENGGDGSPSWLSILPLLPTGLRDMLHSRSCRSAIMFNDVLSEADCEKLLKGLSQCVFPFICAHGRTSMVPLAELESDGAGLDIQTGSAAIGCNAHASLSDRERSCDISTLAKWMKEK